MNIEETVDRLKKRLKPLEDTVEGLEGMTAEKIKITTYAHNVLWVDRLNLLELLRAEALELKTQVTGLDAEVIF